MVRRLAGHAGRCRWHDSKRDSESPRDRGRLLQELARDRICLGQVANRLPQALTPLGEASPLCCSGRKVCHWEAARSRLRLFPLDSESRDRRLAVALGHVEISGRIFGEVRVMLRMPAPERLGGELGAPHVRLQLLEGQWTIATRHVSYLHGVS